MLPETPADSVPLLTSALPVEDASRASSDLAPEADARRWFPTTALLVYAACRLLTLIGVAVTDLITHNGLVADLTAWDGTWFLKIVRHGYPAVLPMVDGRVAENPIAFFPLFPMAVRALASVGIPPAAGSLVISAVTGATAVVAVGFVAQRIAGDTRGERAALLFAVFPGTFAFSFAYSEGIAITCIGFGLIALLDRRWWLAGVLGALATAASPVALAFVVSCAWCGGRAAWKDRTLTPLLAPVLAPLGIALYMLYLWVHTGMLMAWRLTERGGWKSYPSLSYPFHILYSFVTNPLGPTFTGQILLVGTVGAIIGIVLMIRERQPAAVLLYGLSAAAMAAFSHPVGLRPRFLMLAFPIVIALGTRYSGWVYRCMLAVSVILLVLFTILEVGSRSVFP